MASRERKLARVVDRAYAAYRSAAADVIVWQASLGPDATAAQLAAAAKLRRRAGAYHAQWLAAARRLEQVNA